MGYLCLGRLGTGAGGHDRPRPANSWTWRGKCFGLILWKVHLWACLSVEHRDSIPLVCRSALTFSERGRLSVARSKGMPSQALGSSLQTAAAGVACSAGKHWKLALSTGPGRSRLLASWPGLSRRPPPYSYCPQRPSPCPSAPCGGRCPCSCACRQCRSHRPPWGRRMAHRPPRAPPATCGPRATRCSD